MELTVSNKTLDTSSIKNLLRQGEANVDSPVIVLDKTYNDIDISGYTFTLRAASDKNTLVSRVLQKEVLTDKIRLTWEVVPEYTAVPGPLHITIVGTSATGEDIIKITADAINVLSDPASWSAPSPDVVADAINQMTAILVDATAEANRAAAEADRLIDVGVRFRVMGAYDTLAALEAAVTAPAVGDAYQVGTTDVDRVIYLWNGTTWANIGAIQGAEGPQGPAGPKGDPSTVCGKTADASGNIILDTTDLLMTGYTKPTSGGDIAGTDTLMQAIQRLAYNVGLLSNPNLLINWDFRKPVNQRGQASYTGIGYTIDKWYISNARGTVTVGDGHINFSSSLDGGSFLFHYIEQDYSGEVVTLSTLIDGVVYYVTATLSKTMLQQSVSVGGLGSLKIEYNTSKQLYQVIFSIGAGVTLPITCVKLEKGPISTLANDQPANYGEQLALCQRYQLKLVQYSRYPVTSIATNTIDFAVSLPVTMRTIPIINADALAINTATAGIISGFTFAVQLATANQIMIRASKTGHGLTASNGIFLIAQNSDLLFDANL